MSQCPHKGLQTKALVPRRQNYLGKFWTYFRRLFPVLGELCLFLPSSSSLPPQMLPSFHDVQYSIPLCPSYSGGLRPPNGKSNEPFLPEAMFLGVCHSIKGWLRQLLILFSRRLHVLLFHRGSLFRLLFLLLFCLLLLYMCVRCVCARVCTHPYAALESQSSPSSFMRSVGTKLRLPDLHSESPLTTEPPHWSSILVLRENLSFAWSFPIKLDGQ